MRTPNTTCYTCGKPIYRRPSTLEKCEHSYCSRKCQGAIRKAKKVKITCQECGKEFFVPTYKKDRKYCSHACSNRARRGITYTGEKYENSSKRRLAKLENTVDFSSCMVKGCNYNKMYHIHRLIPGRKDGKYEIGNMFAICPNHHAEIHRGITKVIKVNNHELEIIE